MPAVVAKGVEDTAFYRYARLLALYDVGGDPGALRDPVRAFHAANAERGDRSPLACSPPARMTPSGPPTSRARIAALTWVADEWEERVRRWLSAHRALRRPRRPRRAGALLPVPDARRGLADRARADARVHGKALREAKRNTSWVEQNTAWEDAVLDFCGRLYSSTTSSGRASTRSSSALRRSGSGSASGCWR